MGRISHKLTQVAGLALLAGSLLSAASVGVILWRGQMWTCGCYVGGPRLHLLALGASVFGAYLFLRGIRHTRAEWLGFAGRMGLLGLSALLAIGTAEFGLRLFLAARQNNDSVERLRELRARGQPLPIRSRHALAYIIEPSDDPQVVYELQPRLDIRFGQHALRTNGAGMREDRDYPIERSPRSVRIVGIGDSGMFGWNVEQDRNYLAVLETNRQARTNGVTCEVLNLAVPGYNTRLEVERLRARGLAYRPDIVVVGWSENDVEPPFFLARKEDYWRRDVSFLYSLLFNRSLFRDLAKGVAIEHELEFDSHRTLSGVRTGVGAEGVTNALRDLKGLSEKHGFRVLVFGPMRPEIARICESLGLPFSNTLEEIPPGRYPDEYCVHFMHPRADGHRVLAEHLERKLEEKGWLQPARDR